MDARRHEVFLVTAACWNTSPTSLETIDSEQVVRVGHLLRCVDELDVPIAEQVVVAEVVMEQELGGR
jgi:hypothetical protein